LVAARNSRSGAPSNLEPMSSRSSLMFLSVNGTARSYRRAKYQPRGSSRIRSHLRLPVAISRLRDRHRRLGHFLRPGAPVCRPRLHAQVRQACARWIHRKRCPLLDRPRRTCRERHRLAQHRDLRLRGRLPPHLPRPQLGIPQTLKAARSRHAHRTPREQGFMVVISRHHRPRRLGAVRIGRMTPKS
jgi:hypothetical protein